MAKATWPFQYIISFFLMFFNLTFFLKYLTWSLASLGQNLLLKFKKTCINAEQSIPLKDLPPHLYFIFLKIFIFLNGFFSTYEIGFISFLWIQPFENFKKLFFFFQEFYFWTKRHYIYPFTFIRKSINFCF